MNKLIIFILFIFSLNYYYSNYIIVKYISKNNKNTGYTKQYKNVIN